MNGGNLMRAYRDEHGFTLVEVVMATVILFFASTALIGLATATITTAITAKEKNLMVNAVASYVEQLKGMDYDDIGVEGAPSDEVSGTLSATTTLTVEGFDITITPQVFWVDDPNITGAQDYKLLRVTVEAVPVGGGRSITYVTETQIRDVGMSWGWGGSDADAPTIEFGFGSPGEMDVVSGPSVLISAEAASPMEAAVLATMNFYCDTQLVHSISPGTKTWNEDFLWDSTSVTDGIRSIKIEVWDNFSQQSFRIRRVLVDNYAPNVPEQPWVERATDSTVHLAWDVAMDGTDPASSYWVKVSEDTTGSWVHTDARDGVSVTETGYALPVYGGGLYPEPFRRFHVWLYAQSPNFPADSGTDHAISDPFISPPLLSGEWTVSRTIDAQNNVTGETTNTLQWSAPQFPVSLVDFEYTLYRGTDLEMSDAEVIDSWNDPDAVLSYVDSISWSGNKFKYAEQYYYRLLTVLTPTGLDAAGSVQVWSNVAGPNDSDTGTGEMEETW